MRRYSHALAVTAILVVANLAMGTVTQTFATFPDPSSSSTQPLFTIAPDLSSVSAGWTGSGLTLSLPFDNRLVNNVKFQLLGTGNASQPGHFDFWTDAGPLMRIDFQSATLTEFGMAARDTTANPNKVEFTYYPWGTNFNPTNESFSFSFTNFGEDPNGNMTATAAFTSAAMLPEPATLGFLALGVVMMIRRR